MTDPTPPVLRPFAYGANHRSSSLMLRDRLFVEEADMPAVLARLRETGLRQGVVLSTCDRVEVQGVHEDPEAVAGRIAEVLAVHAELTPADLTGQTYLLKDTEAVRHVFAVAASLDSLMVGEPQVLGQVKASHRLSHEVGLTGGELEGLLQAAYAAAKRIRTETGIGERPVSIAAVAVQLARDLHGDLDRSRGLLVGAGDMGELVAEDLIGAGIGSLTVTHPSEPRAEAVARSLSCHVAPFDGLADLLVDADIVLTSMGTRRHVITADMMAAALRQRRNRPVFLIDTGIPGDIEPAVNGIDEAFLYDLGDLERVAMEGRANREAEARAAWRMLDEAVADYLRGRAERVAVPALTQLRERFEAARVAALADAGGDADKATRLLVNRLLHEPSRVLRDAAGDGTGGEGRAADFVAMERLLRRLFGLDPTGGGDDTEKR